MASFLEIPVEVLVAIFSIILWSSEKIVPAVPLVCKDFEKTWKHYFQHIVVDPSTFLKRDVLFASESGICTAIKWLATNVTAHRRPMFFSERSVNFSVLARHGASVLYGFQERSDSVTFMKLSRTLFMGFPCASAPFPALPRFHSSIVTAGHLVVCGGSRDIYLYKLNSAGRIFKKPLIGMPLCLSPTLAAYVDPKTQESVVLVFGKDEEKGTAFVGIIMDVLKKCFVLLWEFDDYVSCSGAISYVYVDLFGCHVRLDNDLVTLRFAHSGDFLEKTDIGTVSDISARVTYAAPFVVVVGATQVWISRVDMDPALSARNITPPPAEPFLSSAFTPFSSSLPLDTSIRY